MHTHHRRPTIGVGLSILLALMAVLIALFMAEPSQASAAPHPHHNYGLTIAATPDPSTAGDGVLIYGRLLGPNNADKKIWLFHRINPAPRFTPIQVTRTNAQGFYEITRADGIVNSNRNWFVLGPDNTHSKTIHELVAAEVTLSSASASATTAQTVDFTGTVFPTHVHERVLLQEQNSTSGNGWKTIDSGYTDGSSSFSINHRFREAGSYTLRAFFPADPRNIASQSASISQTIEQEQNPSFTINASSQALVNGQSETITGTLYTNGSTTTVQPNVSVTLYGRDAGSGGFKALESTQTNSSGDYTFTTMPVHNTVYRVAASAKETTAELFVGVQDVVTATPSSTTVTVGGTITISGTVTPDHTGHVVYLEKQNTAGQWVVIQASAVSTGSQYEFGFTPGLAGTKELRVQITGGPWNLGGISPTVVVTVSGVAPVTSLPPAS
jgi:hypothetical protein